MTSSSHLDRPRRRVQLAIRRAMDLLVSLAALLLLSPLMLLVAIAVKLDSRGPVFFRQDRIGLHGRIFRIFKFRTMAPNDGRLIVMRQDDDRITRLGQFLRKYRLDEIPQFINVFKGEMSLVGPRPLVPDHADRWSDEARKRLWMPPGITGWQQINGGETLNWDQRVALEVWYVEHWSLWLDLKIILRTPAVVFKSATAVDEQGFKRSAIPPDSGGAADGNEAATPDRRPTSEGTPQG